MRSVAYMLVVMTICLSVQPGCEEKPRRAPRKPETRPAKRPAFQPEHARALAVANAFCEAWRMGDYPTARLMLSQRITRKYPERHIRDILADASGPQHVAFEIFDARPLGADSVAFKLRLFFAYAGQRDSRYESPTGRIVMRRGPNGRWMVDAFPSLE